MFRRITAKLKSCSSRTIVMEPPFEACFRCGYCLAGHTLPLQCPECGTPHDEATRVLVREHGILDGTPFLDKFSKISLCAMMMLQVLIGMLALLGAGRGLFQIVVVLVVSCTVVELALWIWSASRWSRCRPRSYLACAPEGLVRSDEMPDSNQVQSWEDVRLQFVERGKEAVVGMCLSGMAPSPEQCAAIEAAIDARLATLAGQRAERVAPAPSGLPAMSVDPAFWGDHGLR